MYSLVSFPTSYLLQREIEAMKCTILLTLLALTLCNLAAGRCSADDLFPDKGLEAAVRYEVFAKRYNQEPLTAEDVKNISKVEGKGKSIKSLQGLEQCVAVQLIDLENNQIEDLAPLAGLKLLQSINLAHNKIASIEALKDLERVQYLQLTGNAVSDLKPLAKMKNMMSLYLSENKLEDIAVVAELPKVWSLYLAGNPIKSFEPIAGCQRVDTLDLSKCGVKDLAFLKPLTELKRLMLENNQIEDLAPLLEMAQGDKEHRFAPFWNIHLKGNPLGEATEKQIEELKQLGARLHLE
jgi:internalin A